MSPAASVRRFFVSLKLTVVLLGLSIILVFWATLAQVHLGVWAVQQKFFHSFIVWQSFGSLSLPVFPGGYAIGGLLLVNLVFAHIYRFKATWRKAGLWLAHAGLILLLVGELLSGLMQKDYQMRIDQGGSRNYSESVRDNELAVVDTTNERTDTVVAIPESVLAKSAVIQNPALPFKVAPRAYYPNSVVAPRSQMPMAPKSAADHGVGVALAVMPLEPSYQEDSRNVPSAYVELLGPEGSLGTFLVSLALAEPQAFSYAGRSFSLQLRPARRYHDFSISLIKFSHDVYPGTDIPKNFSSRVRIEPRDKTPSREVLIYMNNPLRYAGLTFYQQSFENDDKTTVLEVVRNPGWLLPYIACSMVALGLVLHFVMHLIGFTSARRSQ